MTVEFIGQRGRGDRTLAAMTSKLCRVFPCAAPCFDATSWCQLHWNEFTDRLVSSISDIAKGESQRIYVGRTNYPERRLLEHFTRDREHKDEKRKYPDRARDYLAVLHWSGSWREIDKLERCLIERTRRPKQMNKDPHSKGDWYGNWCCVYVSWAFQERASSFDQRHHVREVHHLDWPIVYPTEGFAPIIIKCALTTEKARKELADLSERRKAFSNLRA